MPEFDCREMSKMGVNALTILRRVLRPLASKLLHEGDCISSSFDPKNPNEQLLELRCHTTAIELLHLLEMALADAEDEAMSQLALAFPDESK